MYLAVDATACMTEQLITEPNSMMTAAVVDESKDKDERHKSSITIYPWWWWEDRGGGGISRVPYQISTKYSIIEEDSCDAIDRSIFSRVQFRTSVSLG